MQNIFKIFDKYNQILKKNKHHGALFLGDCQSAVDINVIADNDISLIVNCSKDLHYITDKYTPQLLYQKSIKNLELCRIPVNDSLKSEDIYAMCLYYKKITPFLIKKLIDEKKNILIHCRAGAQRSASLVVVMIFQLITQGHLRELGLNYNPNDREKLLYDIIQYVYNIRPRVFRYNTKINFINSIKTYLKLK